MRVESASVTSTLRASSSIFDWVLIVAAILLRIAGAEFSYGAFAILVVHAARGVPQSIQAVFLSWLFASLNPNIFPQASDIEILRILIPIIASARVAMQLIGYRNRDRGISGVSISLLLFLAICVANSLFVSPLPEVSILKTGFFGLTSLCLLGAWRALGSAREYMEKWVLYGLIAVAVLSAPLAMFGIGYDVNESLFQGILSHPQSFGLMMAILLTWQSAAMLQRRAFTWRQYLILAFLAASLIQSHSRTGLLAFGLSMLITGLISTYSHRKELSTVLRSIGHPIFLSIGSVGVVLLIVYAQTFVPILQIFLLKSDADTTVEESFQGARGLLIERSFDNFLEKPVLGNGFAMPSYIEDLDVRYDPIFNLPVGASIEKGVLPVAVLEELGIVGALFLVLLLYSLFRQVISRGTYEMIALLVCALAINLGEAVLFSPSGAGLLVWLIIGMAATKNSGVIQVRRAVGR